MDASQSSMIARLAELMHGSRCTVALTGAGMSTESGLPDYRGPSGLWKERRFEHLANIETFRREPQLFWEFYRERLSALRHAEPNTGHHALAALERAGYVSAVVTQNVDGLHRVAGSRTYEVHGTLAQSQCLACDARVDIDETERRLGDADDGIPRCGCGEPLKPAVVLFGELLPAAIDDAWRLAAQADLLLVCGSSLAVAPVSQLPLVTLSAGGRVAIVNRGPTECDDLAEVRIDAMLGEVLAGLCRELGVERQAGRRDG